MSASTGPNTLSRNDSTVVRAVLAAVLLVASAVSCHSQELPKLNCGVSTNQINFAQTASPDGRAYTLLFDNFSAAADHRLPEAVVARMFTAILGVSPKSDVSAQKDYVINVDLRGFASITERGKTSLVLYYNGSPHAVVLADAVMKAKEAPKKTSSKERVANSDDFLERGTIAPAKGAISVTVIGLAEGEFKDDKSNALITVDSIDFEIVKRPSKM